MPNEIARRASVIIALMALSGYPRPTLAEPATMLDAVAELPARNDSHIAVKTRSWEDGGDIPLEDTQFGNNAFPGLIWSSGPEGTKSYAVVVQDTDGSLNSEPLIHLTLYNIPADATRLSVGMVPEGNPRGSSYGPNYAGNAHSYLGPHPPPGSKHHYHFQVFALDTTIPANPSITYDGLVSAMRGHVLASGEVVGLSEAQPVAAPLPAGAAKVNDVPRHEY